MWTADASKPSRYAVIPTTSRPSLCLRLTDYPVPSAFSRLELRTPYARNPIERKDSDHGIDIQGLDEAASEKIIGILQNRLSQEQEAALVLKHAHWNVTGENFIAVHEMIDPQVEAVLNMADETAERIATLGGSPDGRADAITRFRTWPKFELEGRVNTLDYLKALDAYYSEFIKASRTAITELDELDVISSNIMQDHVQELEKFQWFMRSHLA